MALDDDKAKNKVLDEKYALDYGLVDISTVGHNEKRMSLPNSSTFDPCEGKIDEKLKKITQIKTLRGLMTQLLCPQITDRSIITPQLFRMKIHQVADLFSTEHVNKELFEEVRSLLMGEREKCELLDQYRHMLLMG